MVNHHTSSMLGNFVLFFIGSLLLVLLFVSFNISITITLAIAFFMMPQLVINFVKQGKPCFHVKKRELKC